MILVDLNESIGNLVPLDHLFESVGGEKTMFMEGPFAQSEVVNKNRRNYRKPILESAVNDYVKDYVKPSRAIGELNHPDHPKPNPERASHLTTHLTMEGNNAIGKAKIIHGVPCGKILRSLIEAGVNMGVSTRGIGAFQENKRTNVSDITKYKMFAIDAVADPSAPDAFVKGIMESAELLHFEDGLIGKKVLDEAVRAKKLDASDRIAAFAALMSRLTSL